MEDSNNYLLKTDKKKARKYSGWTQTSTQPANSISKSNKASFVMRSQPPKLAHYNLHHFQKSSKNNEDLLEHRFRILQSQEPDDVFDFNKNFEKSFFNEIKAFSKFSSKPLEQKILKIKAHDFLNFLSKVCSELSKKDKRLQEEQEKNGMKFFDRIEHHDGDLFGSHISQNNQKMENMEKEIIKLRSMLAKSQLENEGLKQENQNFKNELEEKNTKLKQERFKLLEKEVKLGKIYQVFQTSVKEYKKTIFNLHKAIESLELPEDLLLARVTNFTPEPPVNSPLRDERKFKFNDKVFKLKPAPTAETFEILDVGTTPYSIPEETEEKLKQVCQGVQKTAIEMITIPKKMTKKQTESTKEFIREFDKMAKILKCELGSEIFDWFELNPEFKKLVKKTKNIESLGSSRRKSAAGVRKRRRGSRKENVSYFNNSFVY